MFPTLVQIYFMYSFILAQTCWTVIASRTTCYSCNTYMIGSADPKCFDKDPTAIIECDSSGYGDCLILRVHTTWNNGELKVDGEKGCVYPAHLKCFEEATGEKLPVGRCVKTHIPPHVYAIWDTCFQETVIHSFENQHQSTNSTFRTDRIKRQVASTPATTENSTLNPSPIAVGPPPSASPQGTITDRYFEHCLCRGNFCNQKKNLTLVKERRKKKNDAANLSSLLRLWSLIPLTLILRGM